CPARRPGRSAGHDAPRARRVRDAVRLAGGAHAVGRAIPRGRCRRQRGARRGAARVSVARRVRAALMDRSLAELGDRALQAGRAAMERAGLSSDTAAPTATDWRAELRDVNGRPFADAAAALGEFRARAPARFFAGTADIAATLAAIRAVDPGAESRTIELADATAGGRHRLLGYDALDYGTPPDWHLNPVHGRRAPLAHWSKVPYLDEGVVGDLKLILEFNRHQWLVHLAKAY